MANGADDIPRAKAAREAAPPAARPTRNWPGARGAATAPARPPAVACVGRDYLHSSPAGAVTGSIGSGEPLRGLARRGAWRRVATEFGATGWVPARDLCG